MQERSADSRQLPATGGAELRFLIRFLPAAQRIIQAYGLTLFHIRYWHPIFVAWRETRRTVTVRYHPEDMLRVFLRDRANRCARMLGMPDLYPGVKTTCPWFVPFSEGEHANFLKQK
jgi:hypothetical protein